MTTWQRLDTPSTPNRIRPGRQSPDGRRSFLSILLGGGFVSLTGSIFYPIWRFVFPPSHVPVAEDLVDVVAGDEILPNSAKLFSLGGEPAILVRTPQGDFRAFTATCTHLACTVQYRSDLAHIWCACHDGHFDLTGRNVGGPPPRPLTPLQARIREGVVVVGPDV